MEVLMRNMLFADGARLTAHIEEQLQGLRNNFSKTCQMFSLKKTNVRVEQLPNIKINNCDLEVAHEFTYLGFTISNSP